MNDAPPEPTPEVYVKAWRIIRSFGAERPTRAETAATLTILNRMGAFGRSQREVLAAAGWFEASSQ